MLEASYNFKQESWSECSFSAYISIYDYNYQNYGELSSGELWELSRGELSCGELSGHPEHYMYLLYS